jgi:succinyl-CoA synthetase beta subunit
MKIHEYQGKSILRKFGVPTPKGSVAFSVEEAVAAAKELGGPIWVVKSQIHAGGRGKGRFVNASNDAELDAAAAGHPLAGDGGVRLARSIEEVRVAAEAMLGNVLVTKQTGKEGREVGRIYIEDGCDIADELYVSVVLDRSNNKILVMASSEGGTDIEDVAEETPEKIHKVWIDPAIGFAGYQGRQLAFALGITGKTVRKAGAFLDSLYRAYMASDCDMVEVNPLVVTGGGDVIALDCKMSFDSNALYRQPEILEMRDLAEEDDAEMAAAKYNLSYVNLDGNIGCMVNGAGLAMSTMDIIQYKGAEPANFLDVGGGAGREQVAAAFRIITADPRVKAILVNIFGGIMKCDVIAEGIIEAVKEVGLEVPLVVRLAGTNVDLGKKILAESDINVIPAGDLNEAADAVVAAIQ